jgi:ubiquinone/menaquinone biosynthesis C-methylase UbiE
MRRSAVLLSTLSLAVCQTQPAAASEVDRIVEVLAITAGARVADVGAGNGEWSLALAERVGSTGRIFATEVDGDEIRAIEKKVEISGLSNITVIRGNQKESGLPDACCDAILLRLVYHHFLDPASMLASLQRALLPGGQLAVIDITPQSHWRSLEGVPDRGGHGISPEELVTELTSHGFRLVARYDDWNGDSDRFCLVLAPALAETP